MKLPSFSISLVLQYDAHILKICLEIEIKCPKIILTRYFACTRAVIHKSFTLNSSKVDDFFLVSELR